MFVRANRWVSGCLVVLALFGCSFGLASADTLQSSNYRFDETDLGGGGLNQASSANYSSVLSVSDNFVGDSASANFQTAAGSQQTPDPSLTFIVNNGSANFGSFSPTVPATATTSFSIINYTSYGYIAQISGTTPRNGTHVIPGMTTTGASQAGTEQFGINLAANTSPSSVGTNPIQGLFGVGTATPNYSTSNNYRYVSGETIASATKSSGLTTYTITYLVNVKNLTPGGEYTSNQTIIVVGTY